jgi:hypothetical protein
MVAKVVIIFETTKKPHDGGSFHFSFFGLLFYTSSIFLPNASAMRDSTSMLVAYVPASMRAMLGCAMPHFSASWV